MADDYNQESVDAKGGYAVTEELAQLIIDAVKTNTYLANYYDFYPMAQQITKIPKITSGLRSQIKHIAEAGTYGESQVWNMAQVILTARKLGHKAFYTSELEEDWATVGGAEQKMIEYIAQAFAEALEYVALWGDTSTYNPATSQDQRAMCDGIYVTTPDEHKTDLAGVDPTIDKLRDTMAFVEDSGAKVVALLMPPRIAGKVKKFKEAETLIQYIEGGNARKIEGRVAVLDGADVLVTSTDMMPYRDYSGTDVGDIIVLGEKAGSFGVRRQMTMHKKYDEDVDAQKITTYGRFAWSDLTDQDDATSRLAILENVKAEP